MVFIYSEEQLYLSVFAWLYYRSPSLGILVTACKFPIDITWCTFHIHKENRETKLDTFTADNKSFYSFVWAGKKSMYCVAPTFHVHINSDDWKYSEQLILFSSDNDTVVEGLYMSERFLIKYIWIKYSLFNTFLYIRSSLPTRRTRRKRFGFYHLPLRVSEYLTFSFLLLPITDTLWNRWD